MLSHITRFVHFIVQYPPGSAPVLVYSTSYYFVLLDFGKLLYVEDKPSLPVKLTRFPFFLLMGEVLDKKMIAEFIMGANAPIPCRYFVRHYDYGI